MYKLIIYSNDLDMLVVNKPIRSICVLLQVFLILIIRDRIK